MKTFLKGIFLLPVMPIILIMTIITLSNPWYNGSVPDETKKQIENSKYTIRLLCIVGWVFIIILLNKQ